MLTQEASITNLNFKIVSRTDGKRVAELIIQYHE